MAALIPRVVHRIWFGPHEMRDELVQYGKAWEALGYEVRHWTEANLPPLVNRKSYDEAARRNINTGCAPRHLGLWTQRADIVSYDLVLRFGGIYANCDIEPLRDLAPLLDDVDAFAGWEVQEQAVCNAIFGATVGHPFMQRCVDLLEPRFFYGAGPNMQDQTGPGLITAANGDDVEVFDRHIFYPYGFEDMTSDIEHADYPDSYTSHHWGHKRG